MPPSGSALASLILTNIDSRMGAIAGHHPLTQKTPRYYIEMCNAIGKGIIQGGPVIDFVTDDTGLAGEPLVEGIGAGIGIINDPTWFVQDLYTRIRNYVLADYGRTAHPPYPPTAGSSGEYLLAFCEGINDSFLNYYPTAWTLASTHPQIYQGTGMINNGEFSGLSAPTIQGDIVALAPDFLGPFWPRLAQAVSESYVLLIEQHSTGTVTITGTCIPDPLAPQICNISGSTGHGMGTAS